MFYTFHQNNSGGSFAFAKGLYTENVIIEANSLDEAVTLAESLGLYFDGVAEGRDCDCCGDRWYNPWYDDGTDEPEIYGKSPAEHAKDERFNWMGDNPSIYVHYLDGRTEAYG